MAIYLLLMAHGGWRCLSDTPRRDAIGALAENVDLVVDDEYEFLSVEVYDQDPVRAAAMSNFFVRELNRIDGRLSSQTFRAVTR